MANEVTYQSEFTGQQMDERFTAVATLSAALEALTGVVAQKYVKPAAGIPSTDMDEDVQAALAKALTAVQSLADYYTKAEVDALLAAINAQEYVDVSTLPTASASTMGKIYLVGPDGSGYYSYYISSYDGSAYSWVGPLGTTEISLANYATKAELSQLDQEVTDIENGLYKAGAVIDLTQETHRYGHIDITAQSGWASRSYKYHFLIPTRGGCSFVITAPTVGNNDYAFLKESPVYNASYRPDSFPSFANGYTDVVPLLKDIATTVIAPFDAKYLYITAPTNSIPALSFSKAFVQRVEEFDKEVAPLLYPGQAPYFGERIQLDRPKCKIIQYAHLGIYPQGGAIFDGKFFFCDDDGSVRVYDMTSQTVLATFYLDGYQTFAPHCNAVFFGAKYDDGDDFPVLYVNAYGSEQPRGTLYGYRLSVSGGVYSSTLVQTITVGFTATSLWTDGSGDVRPYGNFVLDTDNGRLYAYTLLDTTKVTRFFAFTMPAPSSGNKTLQESDILFRFDCPYISYIQDSCYKAGYVFICSGMGNAGRINAVDLTGRKLSSVISLMENGYDYEPEFIDVYDGKLFCGKYNLYQFEF